MADYETWSVAKLKAKLQEMQVSSSGSKTALVDRLRACTERASSARKGAGTKRCAPDSKNEATPKRAKTLTGRLATSTPKITTPAKTKTGRLASSIAKKATTKTGRLASSSAKKATTTKGRPSLPSKGFANFAKFEAKMNIFQTWSNDKMKALLKANDQSRSGNKAVLIAKCADGAAFGRLPRCPKCYGGKIKFRLPCPSTGSLISLFRIYGGAYGEDKLDDKKEDAIKQRKRLYCTGFYDDDEKQDCDWQADHIKREPWKAE